MRGARVEKLRNRKPRCVKPERRPDVREERPLVCERESVIRLVPHRVRRTQVRTYRPPPAAHGVSFEWIESRSAWGAAEAAPTRLRHVPVQTGSRLSRNAATPSAAS